MPSLARRHSSSSSGIAVGAPCTSGLVPWLVASASSVSQHTEMDPQLYLEWRITHPQGGAGYDQTSIQKVSLQDGWFDRLTAELVGLFIILHHHTQHNKRGSLKENPLSIWWNNPQLLVYSSWSPREWTQGIHFNPL